LILDAINDDSNDDSPANYNDNYAGRITFARALILSANAATVLSRCRWA